jgi:phage terminase Nu1 subunit (DNA packaging protein)
MKRILAIALAATTMSVGVAIPQLYPATPAAAQPQRGAMRMTTDDFRAANRKLWEDHINFTRGYIITALAGLPDADAEAARLLKNQEDIGAAVGQFYGAAAGAKLTDLLKQHIMIATDVLKAAKAGNNTEVATQQQRWSANADEIAAFISSANPNLPRATVRDMLQRHLDLTTQEVVSRLQSNWAADIAAYDANHTHMLMFSDALANAIEKQFPLRFRATGRG